jgi:hypothetical protein
MERRFLWAAMLVALIVTASVFWVYEFSSGNKASDGTPSSLSVSTPPLMEDQSKMKIDDQAKLRTTQAPTVKIPVRPRASVGAE